MKYVQTRYPNLYCIIVGIQVKSSFNSLMVHCIRVEKKASLVIEFIKCGRCKTIELPLNSVIQSLDTAIRGFIVFAIVKNELFGLCIMYSRPLVAQTGSYHENWFQSIVVPARQGKFLYLFTIVQGLWSYTW